jgi:hypothetical protein
MACSEPGNVSKSGGIMSFIVGFYNSARNFSALSNQPPWELWGQWLRDDNEDRLSSEPSSRTTLKPEN